MIHYDPQARWIYLINVLFVLCSDFSRLVGNGGSIFYRDIRDLWSVYNTNSCTEGPQNSEKIFIHYDPQASWIYFINVLLCSDFSRLVGYGGSIFYRDIRDLWSIYNTKSCIEVPQDFKNYGNLIFNNACKEISFSFYL